MTEVATVTRPGEVPANAAPRRLDRPDPVRHGPGDLAAAELARSRELHPSRRWTPEQRRLRESVNAQRAVGALLEPLALGGNSVLHGVRVLGAGLVVDHVVVTPGAVFVIVDQASDRKAPVGITASGLLNRGGISLERLSQLASEAAQSLAGAAGEALPLGWQVLTVSVIAVFGRSFITEATVVDDISVVPSSALRSWTSVMFPDTIDLLAAAQIGAAVGAVCW